MDLYHGTGSFARVSEKEFEKPTFTLDLDPRWHADEQVDVLKWHEVEFCARRL